MTTDYAWVPGNITVAGGVRPPPPAALDSETIYYVFVRLDEHGSCQGVMTLRKMGPRRPAGADSQT